MESDSDSDASIDNEDVPVGIVLRRRPAGVPGEAAHANSGRKTRQSTRKVLPTRACTRAGAADARATRAALPSTRKAIAAHLQHLRPRLRGAHFDEQLSLRVVHFALKEKDQYLETKGKKAKVKGGAQVRDTVCAKLGIGSATYSAIMQSHFGMDYNKKESRTAYESGDRGNFTDKATRIPQTSNMQGRIRHFVRIEQQNRKRVTGKQVLEMLIDEGILFVPKDNDGKYLKKEYDSAYRITRLWLSRNGYRRGKRKGNLALRENIRVKRDVFLKEFFANRAETDPSKRLREVFLDESYIHQHYNKNEDSLWDPSDDQDVQYSKAPQKGNRYCFLCAIQGPAVEYDHDVDCKVEFLSREQPSRTEDMAGVVPNSVWTFCPQDKKMHKGDYHKVFNSKNFTEWFRNQLIPKLKEPSLIVMDNAAYHCVYPESVPKVAKCRKADLIAYCTSKGLPVEPGDTVAILKKRVSEHIKEHEEREVEILAREAGHRVLWQPPHHSDFQPIELLWAKLKGNIGRQYSINTTMSVLKQRLDDEFEKAKDWHDSIAGMIRKSRVICRSYYASGMDEDENSESSDHGDSSSDEESVEQDETMDLEDGREGMDANKDDEGSVVGV